MSVAEDMQEGFVCCECGGNIEDDRFECAGGELDRAGSGDVIELPGYPVPCKACRPTWEPGQ